MPTYFLFVAATSYYWFLGAADLPARSSTCSVQVAFGAFSGYNHYEEFLCGRQWSLVLYQMKKAV